MKFCTALAALLVATAWARHPAESQAPLSDAEAFALAEDASLDLGGVALGDDAWSLASGKNVSLYCNGKEVTPEEHATQLGGNKTKVYSCWGTFKAFKKGTKEGMCYAGGVKCEGHFLFIKPVCDAKIAVCEGLTKRFHAVAFKKGGKKLAVLKAGGCLGKSAIAIAPPMNKSRRGDDAELVWPAEMPEARAQLRVARSDVGALAMWAGEYVGPHAALVATLLRSGEAKTLAKATCEGLGGGFTAVKKAGCGAAGYGAGFGADGCAMAAGEEGFTALEGRVNETLGELGVALPPEPSLLPSLDLAALLHGSGPKCSVTCNGRTPWFGGKLPCFGRLAVECAIDTPKGELDFEASCKGFWSGVFGGRCAGFTSAHTEFKDLDSYKFCAGKHGMFVKKGKRGFAFGAGCKGKALGALQLTEDEDDD